MSRRFAANFLYTELILASASPQRPALLHEYGFRFRVHPADIDETPQPGLSPAEVAHDLAIKKANVVAERFPTEIVLAADTIVVSASGEMLGKPQDETEAEQMLCGKSGATEQIITGFCLVSEHGCVAGTETSTVRYRDFGEDVLRALLRSGEWREVAGALRIEGEQMQRIILTTTGDYHNIIGLPVGRIAEILRSFPV